MSKRLAALVCLEVFYETLLLTSATEPHGNITCVVGRKHSTMLSFKKTRSLSAQANNFGFTKPSNCYFDTIIRLKQLRCIIIKIANDCRQLVVHCPGVTQIQTS